MALMGVMVFSLLFATGAAPPVGSNQSFDDSEESGSDSKLESRRQPQVADLTQQFGELVNSSMNLLDSTLVVLNLDTTPAQPALISLPLDGQVVTLDLTPHSVLAPGYQLLAQVADGSIQVHQPGPIRTMRGFVHELPGAIVAGAILEDGLSATIHLPDGQRWWVEPAGDRAPAAPAMTHVIYRGQDVISSGGTCDTDHDLVDMFPAAGGGVAGGSGCGVGLCIAELANDADFEYFQNHGSNVNTVEAVIANNVNVMNLEYESEVNIAHLISAIIVRTSDATDPYTSTDSFTLVNQVRTEWLSNQNAIPRDITQLFTGKNINGSTIGRAWTIGGVCTTAAYSFSQSDCCGSFACSTDLHAHENGHIWDGIHCNGTAGCSNTTMFTPLQCVNTFAASSISRIVSHRNSRTCLDLDPNDCNNNGIPDDEDINSGFSLDCNNNGIPDECEGIFESCNVLNDVCSNATIVGEGGFAVTTVGAFTDGPEQTVNCGFPFQLQQVQSDVWYRYTSSEIGFVTASICNANFDTTLVVYGATCPDPISGAFEALHCSDDDCGTGSQVTFLALAGETFTIRIGSLLDEQGDGTLTISFVPLAVCGNGIAEPGENCLNCPQDVQCPPGSTCVDGVCDTICGNGVIDPGEDCANCPQDVSCPPGEECVTGICLPLCGNGVIDPGEDCLTCPQDVSCPPGQECVAGICLPLCGNGLIDPGEDCTNCPQDVSCPPGEECVAGVCQPIILCGNGVVDPGEDCTTCPADVPCPPGSTCVAGVCQTLCPADCASPSDGLINVTDLLALLAGWGGPGLCDTDNSGGTDVTDLLALLAAWGVCQ